MSHFITFDVVMPHLRGAGAGRTRALVFRSMNLPGASFPNYRGQQYWWLRALAGYGIDKPKG
jgi:hypothetical protein